MLVELECILSDLNAELTAAMEERDQFVLANEDTLNEFLYEKKLSEIDARIEHLHSEIISFEKEYRDALRHSH